MSTNQKELLEKHEEWQDTEEIDADLFIITNGTCIKKEEFTYPMWFRYKVFDLGYIVRFDSLTTGEVIPHHNWTLDCYICDNLTPHTNTKVWEQVEEPKEIKQENSINNGGSTDYYKLPKNVKDLQDLIEYKDMNFALGNIFKAVYRLGNCSHSNAIRDLNKIVYFANRELERLKKVNNAS